MRDINGKRNSSTKNIIKAMLRLKPWFSDYKSIFDSVNGNLFKLIDMFKWFQNQQEKDTNVESFGYDRVTEGYGKDNNNVYYTPFVYNYNGSVIECIILNPSQEYIEDEMYTLIGISSLHDWYNRVYNNSEKVSDYFMVEKAVKEKELSLNRCYYFSLMLDRNDDFCDTTNLLDLEIRLFFEWFINENKTLEEWEKEQSEKKEKRSEHYDCFSDCFEYTNQDNRDLMEENGLTDSSWRNSISPSYELWLDTESPISSDVLFQVYFPNVTMDTNPSELQDEEFNHYTIELLVSGENILDDNQIGLHFDDILEVLGFFYSNTQIENYKTPMDKNIKS